MRNGMIMTGLTMVCAAALAGCGQVQPESAQPSAPQPGATVMMASVDYPVYSSLEEMGSRSKVVVRGSFVKLAKRDTERSFATGGDPNQQGLPVAVWEFEVDEQFKGPKVGSRIEVLTFDLDRIQIADGRPVKLGAEVVLFLGRERNGVWARAAGDQAVLDVQSDGALRAHRAADPALAQQARMTQKAELETLVQAP